MKKYELFELIKSLTKSEKRYFKIQCKQMGERTVYIQLFDAMDKQTVFDEDAIRKKFKGERFLDQLHVVKNYLRRIILKSLRNYHHAFSKDAELKDSLRNIEILFNKELFQHSETELKRAERIAVEFELKNGHVEVIKWKRKLEQALRPQNYAGLSEIIEEQKNAISNLQNTNEYWKLAVDLSSQFAGSMPTRETISPMLSDARNAKSVEAKVLFYNCLYVYYARSGKPEIASQSLAELLTYLERQGTIISEDPAMYLSTLNNLLSYHVFRKEFDEALELIGRSKEYFKNDKLKSEKKSLLKQYLRTCNIELEIYRNQKNWKSQAAFITKMEAFVSDNRSKMPGEYLLSFWFQFGYLRFMEHQFEVALKWVNLILGTNLKAVRPDLQMQARMLNLMIHLEQRNYFVLRYFVDSTRRYFKKAKNVQPHEKILFRFFIKMGRAAAYDWKRNFQDLHLELFEQVLDDPSLTNGYIDFETWIAKHK